MTRGTRLMLRLDRGPAASFFLSTIDRNVRVINTKILCTSTCVNIPSLYSPSIKIDNRHNASNTRLITNDSCIVLQWNSSKSMDEATLYAILAINYYNLNFILILSFNRLLYQMWSNFFRRISFHEVFTKWEEKTW